MTALASHSKTWPAIGQTTTPSKGVCVPHLYDFFDLRELLDVLYLRHRPHAPIVNKSQPQAGRVQAALGLHRQVLDARSLHHHGILECSNAQVQWNPTLYAVNFDTLSALVRTPYWMQACLASRLFHHRPVLPCCFISFPLSQSLPKKNASDSSSARDLRM